MKPPKSLETKEEREAWTRCVAKLDHVGVWAGEVDAYMLEQLFAHRRAATVALQAAVAEPVVPGSTGQSTAHPLFRVAATHERLALSLARALRLSPDRRPKPPTWRPSGELNGDVFAKFLPDLD